MIELLILGCFFLILITTLVIKGKLNKAPLIIYISWWTLLFVISSSNPNDLFPVSNQAYLILFLNVLMFFLGYIAISYKRNSYSIKMNLTFGRLNGILLITQLFLFPILLYFFIKYQLLLNAYGHTYARLIRFDLGYLFNSVYVSALYSYIISPMLIVIGIFTAIKFIQKDIKNVTFYLMLVNVVLNTQIGLGRFGYFQLLVFMVVVYFMIDRSDRTLNFKKIGRNIIFTVAAFCLVTVMNFTLLIRKGFNNINFEDFTNGYLILFEQAISYFVGPFRAFDQILNNEMYNQLGPFYGRLTVGGLEHLLGIFFRMIDSNYQIAHHIISPIIQEPIIIGQGQSFNAFYTSSMNHYLDFNVIGILIFPLINGMVVAYVVNSFVKKQNIITLSFLVFFLYNSVVSSLQWSYQFISTWIAMLILFFISIYLKKKQFKVQLKNKSSL